MPTQPVPPARQPVAPARVGAAMAGLWLCWGSSLPAMRVMVATLPPLLASGAVFVAAGAALAATRPGALRGVSFRQAVTAAGVGTCLLGAQGTVALAERHVFASTAALLVAMVPLWVTVLRTALGHRPARAQVARLLLGLAGVIGVLAADPGSGTGWSAWALAVTAAAIIWAAGTLWASRSASLPAPRAATILQLSAGGLPLLAAGTMAGEPAQLAPATVSASSWLALSYLVLIDSLAGFALYTWLLRATTVSLASAYAYAVPVIAYLAGVLALGEPFRPAVLPGATAIIIAVTAEARAISSQPSHRTPGSGR
ncbi:MAG TPA: EamA family transporter [Streptosporangiaceae bacterium]